MGLNRALHFSTRASLFETSPARISTRKSIVVKLNNAVNEFKGEVVLTVFGPSYWKPKVKHICGFADGWCYYPETIALKRLKLIPRIKRILLSKYKLFYLKKDSDYLFIETVDAKKRLIDILNNKLIVIINALNLFKVGQA